MADAYLETTKWEGNTPNHTYLLEGDKLYAYIKAGTNEPFYFQSWMRFEKRGRTFKKLSKNPFEAVAKDPDLIEVTGSKGDTYYVNPVEKTCTCPGFTFRGKCKHVELEK